MIWCQILGFLSEITDDTLPSSSHLHFFVENSNPTTMSQPNHDGLVNFLSLPCVLLSITIALKAIELMLKKDVASPGSRKGRRHIERRRRTLQSLRRECGELFRRAHRMDHPAFETLHSILKDGTMECIKAGNGATFHVPNGPITMDIRLAMALRFFAGGSHLDIIVSHGVSESEFYDSVWATVHAVNKSEELKFHFPRTEEECKSAAAAFSS